MVSTILGISPGTRSIGIGVLRNEELKDWQVKTFKGLWSKEKIHTILEVIESLCQYWKVSEVALKEVHPLRRSKNLKVLIREINRMVKKKGVHVSSYTLDDLKRNSGVHGKHSMNDLMEFITEKYPVLKREYLKERNNLNPYYLKMFEAIAAAGLVNKQNSSYLSMAVDNQKQ